MLIEFISESNNIYEFSIQLNAHTETISIYAPNYETALSRAETYIKYLNELKNSANASIRSDVSCHFQRSTRTQVF